MWENKKRTFCIYISEWLTCVTLSEICDDYWNSNPKHSFQYQFWTLNTLESLFTFQKQMQLGIKCHLLLCCIQNSLCRKWRNSITSFKICDDYVNSNLKRTFQRQSWTVNTPMHFRYSHTKKFRYETNYVPVSIHPISFVRKWVKQTNFELLTKTVIFT